jgi:hypothetical protein
MWRRKPTGAGAAGTGRWGWRALALAGALAVLALQGLAIARQALTSDEAYHSLAGFQADRYGQNGLNLEHPPLLKLLAALPLAAAREPVAPRSSVSTALGTMQAIYAQPGAERRARLAGRAVVACLFGLPLLGAAWRLGRELGGAAAGTVLALLLGLDFSTFPQLSLVYTDAAPALGFGIVLLAAARLLRRPGLGPAAAMGLGLGLAIAGKFTGLLALPALGGALLLAPWPRRGAGGAAAVLREAARRLLYGVLAAAIAWAAVEAVYAVANRHYDPAYGRETLKLYCENRSTMLVGERLRPYEPLLLAIESRDPRAAQWLTGLLATRAQNAIGTYPACNFGRMRSRGLWWYFPVLLLAKTPLPLLLASTAALAAALTGWRRARRGQGARRDQPDQGGKVAAGGAEATPAIAMAARRRFVLLLALSAGLFLAVAMSSNYNAGLRHLLPILPVLYLPAALWAARRPPVAAALLAALLAESLALAPIWVSATNSWWLGGRDPLRFALSTDNCYYPQNLLALGEVAGRRALHPLHLLDPSLGGALAERYLGPGTSIAPGGPLPAGWYAVGTAAEVCVPAILRSSPAEMYGYARYRSIAERWQPTAAAVARAGQDEGYAAGNFHLYRLTAPLPAATP